MKELSEYDESAILVVEDDSNMRSALSKSLGGQGYPVVLAHDGYEALECLEKQPAWLVIADVNMPGKGGIEMLREIRAGGNSVPVVLMTAYSTVETAVQALKLGAADYLQKPFPFQQLESMISRIRHDTFESDEVAAPHEEKDPSVRFKCADDGLQYG